MTVSTPSQAACRLPGSRTSPTTCSGSEPGKRERRGMGASWTRERTGKPCPISCRTTARPTRPELPVTKITACALLPRRPEAAPFRSQHTPSWGPGQRGGPDSPLARRRGSWQARARIQATAGLMEGARPAALRGEASPATGPGRRPRPRPLRTGTVLPKGLALPVGLDHDLALFVQADPDPLHLLLHLAARLADAEVDVGEDPPGVEHPVLDELQRGDGPRLGAYRVELHPPRLDPKGPPDELGAGGQ